jgi:uncharacterized peroxidase-related enzyme
MSWIEIIGYNNAKGHLKTLYDRIKGPDNNIDNIMMAHSLRPHTMEGHMAIYKSVLHHHKNKIPKWFLETLGVHVSLLNKCEYCAKHHFSGLKRLLNDDEKSEAIWRALTDGEVSEAPLTPSQHQALKYAAHLTEQPGQMREGMIVDLRDAGYSDGEILEINQVVAYFNYANRTVTGLGCSTHGDILGLSPGNSDDPEDWGHA